MQGSAETQRPPGQMSAEEARELLDSEKSDEHQSLAGAGRAARSQTNRRINHSRIGERDLVYALDQGHHRNPVPARASRARDGASALNALAYETIRAFSYQAGRISDPSGDKLRSPERRRATRPSPDWYSRKWGGRRDSTSSTAHDPCDVHSDPRDAPVRGRIHHSRTHAGLAHPSDLRW